MDDLEDIQLEDKNYTEAVKWGVLLIILDIVIRFFLKISSFDVVHPDKLMDIGLLTVAGITYLLMLAIRIIVVIYVARIAGKLNRSQFGWGLFALIFPPIALIIIGFFGYKIEQGEIKDLVDTIRLDYRAEVLHLKQTLDVSNAEFEKIEADLKREYESNLRIRIAEIVSGKKADNQNQYDQNSFTDEEYNSEQNVDSGHCPACGATIDQRSAVCPDCGIALL
jgi:hypothetical protein